ncbi:hypothetical protein WME76_40490 [Sorangium sp. So ce119]|uniref:hypothetical protein n=1 Tax=Sorangium sp. So ce119 TaxID=3133279 RepID=UPI003F62EC1D
MTTLHARAGEALAVPETDAYVVVLASSTDGERRHWHVGARASVLILGTFTLGACGAEVLILDPGGGSTSSAQADSGGGATSAGAGGGSTSAGAGGGSTSAGAGGGSASAGAGGGSTSTDASSGSGGAGGAVSAGGGGGPGNISDVFDPAEVYLRGTVQPGSSGRDAMAHWSDPNTAAVGFIGAYDDFSVRLQDGGKLLYVLIGSVREFVCDACPYVGTYLNGSDANDLVLPTAPCVPYDRIEDIKVGPGGSWIHSCAGDWNKHWYDANGVMVYGDEHDMLVHLGYSNLALTQSRVVDLANASSVPIVGLPNAPLLAVRALAPDSFRVALATDQDSGAVELWQIDATGTATLIGPYPPVPAGYTVQPFFPHRHHALEATGALLQIGEGPMVFQDVIVRREIGGSSAVVYDEAKGPLVQIHISGLVTGP